MASRVVVDTSVFIAALIGKRGPNRKLLRYCLTGMCTPLLGNALISEYEDVAGRDEILRLCPITRNEIQQLLDAFCSAAEWVPVYYLLRPNLTDEADNHLLELAAAGNADWLVTNNVRDFERAELMFQDITVITPRTTIAGDVTWQR